MIAFWVDEELEGGVEVAVRLADGTDVCGGIVVDGGFGEAGHRGLNGRRRCGRGEDGGGGVDRG